MAGNLTSGSTRVVAHQALNAHLHELEHTIKTMSAALCGSAPEHWYSDIDGTNYLPAALVFRDGVVVEIETLYPTCSCYACVAGAGEHEPDATYTTRHDTVSALADALFEHHELSRAAQLLTTPA